MCKVFLNKIIGRYFRPVCVFYDCYEKQKYLTITITKYAIGSKLNIGNAIYPEINEWCKSCGALVSQDQIYGYVVFKYGYMIFGGNLKETHFGYCLWQSKMKKSSKHVSTFCIYPPMNEISLKETIYLLKTGEKLIM